MNPAGAVTVGGVPLPQVATVATTTSPAVAPPGTGILAPVANASLPVEELDRYVGGFAGGGAVTVTVVVSEAVALPSLTVSWNVNVEDVDGAVNVGLAADALERVTEGPAVCDQAYVNASPSASVLPEPSRVTVAPVATLCVVPASATGGWFTGGGAVTVTVVVSEAVALPSLTVSWNVNVEDVDGAVNVGLATDALERVTEGPAVCDQAYVNASPSASVLPEPSRVTVAPVATLCVVPASATGGWFTGGGAVTVTVVVSEAVALPSLTVSWNVNVEDVDGAVNVGLAADALERVTEGPAVCDQAYVNASPSASVLPEPSRVTVAPVATLCAVPASATGGWFTGGGAVTVTVVVSEAVALPSLTVSWNVNVEDVDGAVNVGLAADALERVTEGPAVCDQAYVNASPSASVLPEPSRVTVAPVATLCVVPASATGGWFTGAVVPPLTATRTECNGPAPPEYVAPLAA